MKSKRHKLQHARRRRYTSKAPPDWPADLPPPRTDALPDLRPGADIGNVVLTWHGRQFIVPFRVPGDGARRARSDQVAAEFDGHWLTMSLRAALLALAKMPGRTMTRRERAAC